VLPFASSHSFPYDAYLWIRYATEHDEIRRYSRHLILPEVGLAGQKKIKATSVLCIGAGGRAS